MLSFYNYKNPTENEFTKMNLFKLQSDKKNYKLMKNVKATKCICKEAICPGQEIQEARFLYFNICLWRL